MRHHLPLLALLTMVPLHADGGWVESRKITAPDKAPSADFGSSVATDGDLALIGAWVDDGVGTLDGAVYVMELATGQMLHKIPGPTPNGRFGTTVDLSGDVGAVAGTNGAWLVDVGSGQLIQQLSPTDTPVNFGEFVAIEGDVVAVASTLDDTAGIDAGAVYLFDVTTGVQTAKLVPSDGHGYQGFGRAIDLDGGRVLVGAWKDQESVVQSGAAYLFDAATGAELLKVKAGDPVSGDSFGWSVTLDGSLAAIGAIGKDDLGTSTGAAYLFDITTGQQLAKMVPPDGGTFGSVGWDLALDGDRLAIGARGDDEGGYQAGAVYVYDTLGSLQAKLVETSGPTSGDQFGHSVSVVGHRLLVGARWDDEGGADTGAAFLFENLLPVGATYCDPAVVNSSGVPAKIAACGSEVVDDNLLRLRASGMPTGQWGYFVNSQAQGLVNPPGSMGVLCLGGSIGRHSADVMSTGAGGEFSLELDLGAIPTPGGTIAIQAGETWYWQAWFRDNDPGPTSNFTDGVCIAFQ